MLLLELLLELLLLLLLLHLFTTVFTTVSTEPAAEAVWGPHHPPAGVMGSGEGHDRRMRKLHAVRMGRKQGGSAIERIVAPLRTYFARSDETHVLFSIPVGCF